MKIGYETYNYVASIYLWEEGFYSGRYPMGKMRKIKSTKYYIWLRDEHIKHYRHVNYYYGEMFIYFKYKKDAKRFKMKWDKYGN